MLVHLDTDFGGDPDDACALAFLLASPLAELIGVTTNLDYGGYRAACVRHYLDLAGRSDIPVEPGAAVTFTDLNRYDSTAQDPRYWPEPITPAPAAPGVALDLLMRSLAQGATIVAIGAATNLALLEVIRPGTLKDAEVVFMGGWIRSPAEGLPNWGPEGDWNVQCDTRAASILAGRAALTLVTLSGTLNAWLRESHLSRLRASGPIGELLARQSQLYARDKEMATLASTNPGLPPDLLNFHYDPVTAAVALRWSGARMEEMRLQPVLRDGVLRFEESDYGRPMRVVVDVDGSAFSEYWLSTLETLRRPAT